MADLPAGADELVGPAAGSLDQEPEPGRLNASSALRFFLFVDAAILLFAGGHLLASAPSGTIDALFSLDNEPTIPGWYASIKLLLVAGIIAALALSLPSAAKRRLFAAAFIFLLMSCDEAAAIHERVQRGIGNRLLSGVTDHIYDAAVLAKVVLGLAALVVAVTAVAVVVRALRRFGEGRTAFAIGFLLLVAGAVVVDLAYEFLSSGDAPAPHAVILEEAFEMIGVTLMIYGALQALASAPVVLRLGARLHAEPVNRMGSDRPVPIPTRSAR